GDGPPPARPVPGAARRSRPRRGRPAGPPRPPHLGGRAGLHPARPCRGTAGVSRKRTTDSNGGLAASVLFLGTPVAARKLSNLNGNQIPVCISYGTDSARPRWLRNQIGCFSGGSIGAEGRACGPGHRG